MAKNKTKRGKEENKIQKTRIEWVKNPDGTQGYTWNPITGCLNGCPYCYARKLAHGRLKQRYLANKHTGYDGGAIGKDRWLIDTDPFYPRFWEEKLEQLKPPRGDYYYHDYKGIFVCDMSDLFGIGIPEEWTRKVIDRFQYCPQHRFYLLTKQPQNLIKFSPFPDNCWVGVTATDTDMAVSGLTSLSEIAAKVKYISFEPLLSRIPLIANALSDIDWLIIGQQTPVSAKTEPKIEWIREIVEAADKAGIPVFLKDNLKPLFKPNYEVAYPWAYSWGEFRQEMPEARK